MDFLNSLALQFCAWIGQVTSYGSLRGSDLGVYDGSKQP